MMNDEESSSRNGTEKSFIIHHMWNELMYFPFNTLLYAHKYFVGWASGQKGLEKYQKSYRPLAHRKHVNI